ncbi:hypothetical protein, conserved [Plasmodium vivax]|uniref:Uncharacterized protein n=3 Tax=Plasmodium vivax TaxID=5855 RepID=A5K8A3_PLAVS|nr:hypothetical protein, conserved [Plasmodium vivax]EDL44517.1 hypothetical protein, conserved [Plasmodium vivax]KMZ85348.1 hypothetical protein PVBG_02034 [Plasmodium vivax Brazil I]VUZ97359.1 conserved Plasmodium protein, unknown function [Plasmodium vivax]|eukprot:XP_001614244.1 hypothetical protein [Plasmodium vivax Sal-1]
MDMPKGQKPREREGKNERSNLRDIEEAKKIRNQQNEVNLKKFCGSTDFVLDVPNIDEGVKFLKHDVDSEILQFNYTTMLLNEKVERLNDVERNIHIPMDLPFMFSFNMQNNDDIGSWVRQQNEEEHGRVSQRMIGHGKNAHGNTPHGRISHGNTANVGGAHSLVNLNDEVKQISSSAPIIQTFDRDDLELLNRVAPHYIRRVRSTLLQCAERKSRDAQERSSPIGRNTHEQGGKGFESGALENDDGSSELTLKCGKRKVPYDCYFPHPLKKGTKVKKIYPLLPHIGVWSNKYIQGIMEIGNSSDYIRSSGGEDASKLLSKGASATSNSEPKKKSSGMLGLLHLVEKTRDKHLYGLYKAHDVGCDEYILNKYLRRDGSARRRSNGVAAVSAVSAVSGGTVGSATDRDGGDAPDQASDSPAAKKKISLSKFLIKKYLFKLKMREKLRGKLPKGEKVTPPVKNQQEEEDELEEEKFAKSKSERNEGNEGNERSASVELTHRSKRVTFNETNKYEYVEKKGERGEHGEGDDTVMQNVRCSQSTPPDDNVECFKYVRDYKSPSFGVNQNDPLSYVIGFNRHNLAFMFPTLSRKIIFSKTGQQKRKNYIMVREK